MRIFPLLAIVTNSVRQSSASARAVPNKNHSQRWLLRVVQLELRRTNLSKTADAISDPPLI
jgi:hypothetical protein